MPCPTHNKNKICKIDGCENIGRSKSICGRCRNPRRHNLCAKHDPHHGLGAEEYSKHKKEYCEECGITNTYDTEGFLIKKAFLTIHHIDENPKNNDKENLQTLCRRCHDYKHGMRK